jgi:hypothetical protein
MNYNICLMLSFVLLDGMISSEHGVLYNTLEDPKKHEAEKTEVLNS